MAIRELGETLRDRRKALGLLQVDVAKAAGIAQSYLSRIEAGDPAYNEVGRDVLRSLAAVLGEDVDELEAVLYDRPLPARLGVLPELPREIPVVARIDAGREGGLVIDRYEYSGRSETLGKMLRGAHVTGDCMEPELHAGDLVIYDTNRREPRDGQLVVAVIPDPGSERGRGVVKQFYRLNGKIKLAPLVGEPLILAAGDVRIEGVVVEIRRKLAP